MRSQILDWDARPKRGREARLGSQAATNCRSLPLVAIATLKACLICLFVHECSKPGQRRRDRVRVSKCVWTKACSRVLMLRAISSLDSDLRWRRPDAPSAVNTSAIIRYAARTPALRTPSLPGYTCALPAPRGDRSYGMTPSSSTVRRASALLGHFVFLRTQCRPEEPLDDLPFCAGIACRPVPQCQYCAHEPLSGGLVVLA